MTKKTTLNDIAAMLTKQSKETRDLTESVAFVVEHMATKEDLADLRKEMATKDQVIALHTQVNSIEGQLKHGRYETRLGNLEEKPGRIRA